MIHDLTLEQKIEVAAEQIENSLELGLSSEKQQIRLILTQFAHELVSGDNTGAEQCNLPDVIKSVCMYDSKIECKSKGLVPECGVCKVCPV